MTRLVRLARPSLALGIPPAGLLLLPGLASVPLSRIRSGSAGVDDVASLAALGGLAVLLGWVVLVLLAAALTRVPGALGSAAAALACRVTPAATRRAVQLAVGASVVVGPVALPLVGSAALATGPGSAPATSSAPASRPLATGSTAPTMAPAGSGIEIDRPTTSAWTPGHTSPPETSAGASPGLSPEEPLAIGRPATDLPATEPVGPPAASTTQGWTPPHQPDPVGRAVRTSQQPPVRAVAGTPREVETVMDEVVVRRGDSLWSITARHLGPDATDAEIAVEWPRWYAANRDAVGGDPDVILPGTVLRPPSTATTS